MLLLVAVVGAVCSSGAGAAPSSAKAPELTGACALKVGGIMRYVATPSRCTRLETPVSLSPGPVHVCAGALVRWLPRAGTCLRSEHQLVLPAPVDTFFCAGILGLLSPSQGSCPRYATLYVVSKPRIDQAPIAGGDAYGTDEDTPLAVAAPGVLANDSDPDGDSLSAILFSGPAHAASFSLDGDGGFSYTPALGYTGEDSFSYEPFDGQAYGDPVTATITVGAAGGTDLAPISFSPLAGQALELWTSHGVAAPIFSVAADCVSAPAVNCPSEGTVDPLPTMTADLNEHAGDEARAAVSPDAAGGLYQVTHRLRLWTNQPILLTQSGTTCAIGLDTRNGSSPDVSVTLEDMVLAPDGPTVVSVTGISGLEAADYTVGPSTAGDFLCEGAAFIPLATVGAVVEQALTPWLSRFWTVCGAAAPTYFQTCPGNHAPQAGDFSAATSEDTPLVLGGGDILSHVFDTDGDGLALTDLRAASGSHISGVSLSGSTYTVSLEPDWCGETSLTYTASDGQATATGEIDLAVSCVNDPPVTAPDTYTTAEGQKLSVAAPGVLANDRDPEGAPLTAGLLSGPAHGTLTLNADGSFDYIPRAGYSGSDSFTYEASDGATGSGAVTATIEITPGAGVPPAPIVFTDLSANALLLRLENGSGQATFPVAADCAASVTVACPGGTPTDPLPTMSTDLALQAGDLPRWSVVPDAANSRFDLTARFRIWTNQPILVTQSGTTCAIGVDSRNGAGAGVAVSLEDGIASDPGGPTVASGLTLTGLEGADYTVGPANANGFLCDAANFISAATVTAVVQQALTPWISALVAVCGAPAPDYFQSCPSS